MCLPGRPPVLAVVQAAPGRPGGSGDSRVRPSFAGIYGIVLDDKVLAGLHDATNAKALVEGAARLDK